MDDLAAEFAHAFDGGEVCDREVGQREAVAWPAAALVEPEHDPSVLDLPAAALLGVAAVERGLQQPLPEALRPLGVVYRELDQETAAAPLAVPRPPISSQRATSGCGGAPLLFCFARADTRSCRASQPI